MFSMEGPIYRALAVFYRYLVLNLLFLVSCLFIVTIPPSIAGLFAVARKYVNQEEPPVFRTFWRAFRENFLQSWLISLIYFVIGIVVWMDMRVFHASHWVLSGAGSVVISVVALLAAFTLLHVFPLMVHVHLTTRQLFINSLKLNLVKPHLTLLNLLALILWTLLATRVTFLLPILYFSVAATITYWVADRKFKAITIVQNPTPDDAESVDQAGEVDPEIR